jgi:hypothetical protein
MISNYMFKDPQSYTADAEEALGPRVGSPPQPQSRPKAAKKLLAKSASAYPNTFQIQSTSMGSAEKSKKDKSKLMRKPKPKLIKGLLTQEVVTTNPEESFSFRHDTKVTDESEGPNDTKQAAKQKQKQAIDVIQEESESSETDDEEIGS